MSLILSGTDGLSDVDGSAATPAIRGTDANTGIFFPAADTIAFSEGGVESMRISSAGFVGIGDTNPSNLLTVAGTGSDHQLFVRNTGTAASDDAIIQISTSSTSTTSTISGLYFGDGDSSSIGRLNYNHSDNSMAFFTNSAERMRITSSGNVGIGVNSPVAPLDVISGTARIFFSNQSTTAFVSAVNTTNTAYAPLAINGSETIFKTGDAERGRFTSVGVLNLENSTTKGPYLRGASIAVASQGTIDITVNEAGGCVVCVYNTGSGSGGVFWVNYSSTVIKIEGDGDVTDTGSIFAVYKSASSHLTTFKNKTAVTGTFAIAVYSAKAQQ